MRHARGLDDYDLTGKSQDDVVNEILMERRRELWGEGFSITDILRTQQSVKRVALSVEEQAQQVDAWQEGGGFAKRTPLGHWVLTFSGGDAFVPNSINYLYAIPKAEIDANPNL